jgi:hypothetical protein
MSWFNKDANFDLYEERERNVLSLLYQRVFNSDEGRTVLVHLLSSLRFYREIETEEDRILHNAALRILRYSGAWKEGTSDSIIDASSRSTFRKRVVALFQLGKPKGA